MSSHQNLDRQYEQIHAAWLASQRGGRGPQLNSGGGLSGFEGASLGSRYGEFDLFNRSSIPLPRQPPPTGETADYVLRVVGQADHDMLLLSGNEVYANALTSHNGTKEEFASLKRAFDVLVATRSAPSAQCDLDERALEGPALRRSGLARRTAYRRADLPNIKYWTRKEYEDSKNKKSRDVIKRTNESSLPFMEHEDGSPVTEAEAMKMRETARGVFAHFLSEGNAPEKWGQISVVSQEFFFNVLSERHAYVAMCEDMWKVQLLATTCYPSWYRNKKDKVGTQKAEYTTITKEMLEKQRAERIWIEQQLEHGRQLKEEVIEHVDRAEHDLKRNRTVSNTNAGAQSRPSKKVRSTTVRASIDEAAAQPITNRPLPPLSSQSASIPAPPSISRSQHTLSIETRSSSQPSPSHDSTSQRQSTPEWPPATAPLSNPQSPTLHSANQQEAMPQAISESIPAVDDWTYDRTGLDSTNTQELALDRLSVHDSTPYIISSLDEENASLDASGVWSSISLPSGLASRDASQLASKGSSSYEAVLDAEGTQALDDGFDEWEFVSPSTPVVDATTDHSLPLGFDIAAQHANPPSVSAVSRLEQVASPAVTYPPNLPIVTTPDSEGEDLLPPDLSGSPELYEQTAAGAQDTESTAEALLDLHRDVPPGRVRPTPRNPLTPAVPLDVNQLFDRSSGVAANAIRNPLAGMVKERIPSMNVAQDLSSLHEDASADKENAPVKARGRGRPAGKSASPDQLIKPTKGSLTPRNLFALAYKETNRSYPTEAMWQSLEKAEMERLELLSKERKATKKEAKSDSKAGN